jgi:hypothetical protein
MATDQLPLGDVKQVSQSFTFQKMLSLNPLLARAARRDRDRLALEYIRAQKLQNSSPLYGLAVLSGYDPTKIPVALPSGELG